MNQFSQEEVVTLIISAIGATLVVVMLLAFLRAMLHDIFVLKIFGEPRPKKIVLKFKDGLTGHRDVTSSRQEKGGIFHE